jgi:hypothetical protein
MSWTVTTLSADPHVPPLTPLDFTEGRAGEAAETRRRAGVDVQPGRELTPSCSAASSAPAAWVGSRVREPSWQHPWLRIERLIRSIIETRWHSVTRPLMKATLKEALAERSRVRKAGWFN